MTLATRGKVVGNILLIIKILRTFGQFAPLVPLVEQTIAAVRAGDWVEVQNLIQTLLEKAGVLAGGPVKFGSAPLGAACPCPEHVCKDLDALEAQYANAA